MGSTIQQYKNKMFCLFLILLLPTSFYTVQGQEECEYIESRISAFHGIENTFTMNFDIQFYNPNSEDVLYGQPSDRFPELNVSGNLVNKNATVHSTNTLVQPNNIIKFSSGLVTIPVSITISISVKTGTVFSSLSSLVDGNYTVSYYYSDRITNFPATLRVKSGDITAEIPEPDWNYDKQGWYTENNPEPDWYSPPGSTIIGGGRFESCRFDNPVNSFLLYVIFGVSGILLLAIVIVFSLVVRRRLKSKNS